MSKVNEQFDKLFKQLKDGSYPNKSIKAGLLFLFSSFLVYNILRFLSIIAPLIN